MITTLRKKMSALMAASLSMKPSEVEGRLERPRQLGHGHLSFPVFSLAKVTGKSPQDLAKHLAVELGSICAQVVEKVEPLGGYLNFHIKNSELTAALMQACGRSQLMEPQESGAKVIIDYSSPNVAKPMHIGHLRATVIGQAICNLARYRGLKVVALNHLGDWGTQFGKLVWAYQKWGGEYDFKKDPFESLYRLYVRFHEEAEKNPEIESLGAMTFKRLEEGDPEISRLWKWVTELSMTEYKKIWKSLGVEHDLVLGESFYNTQLRPTEALIESKGLLEESEGAFVVRFSEDLKMPPCLIRKSDGASLYATRDLASAMYRHDVLKADVNLYVTGVEQSLHFKQVFKVLEMLGFDWAKTCHHISFGRYRFKDGKMSSRSGEVIRLDDIIEMAIEKVEAIIEEKNPDLADKKTVAEQVAVGAIVFNDLINDRIKDVLFDWDQILDFEGDSGPYIQYSFVRCKGILKKFGKEVPFKMEADLKSPEEQQLLRQLLYFPDFVSSAFTQFKPHILAAYLLDLSRDFNSFYNKVRILSDETPKDVKDSRLALVKATMRVLDQGLGLLNIPRPEAM